MRDIKVQNIHATLITTEQVLSVWIKKNEEEEEVPPVYLY